MIFGFLLNSNVKVLIRKAKTDLNSQLQSLCAGGNGVGVNVEESMPSFVRSILSLVMAMLNFVVYMFSFLEAMLKHLDTL